MEANRPSPKSSTTCALSSASTFISSPSTIRSGIAMPTIAVTRFTGAEEAAQGGQVVDAEVEQGAATRLVEPPTPPRAGPAVAGSAEQQPTDLARLHARVHLLVGLRQHDVGRADELAVGGLRGLDELRRLRERRGHRLLDEHVLAGRQAGLGERPVLVHAGEHEEGVDVVALDHLPAGWRSTGRCRSGQRSASASRGRRRTPP